MATEATKDLQELESQFADNPADIALLRRIGSQYVTRGYYSARVQPIYEKACMAAPDDRRFAEALNITSFLRQLRRFTVETADPDLLDTDGIRDAINLVKQYLKESPASPDLFFALGDLHLVKGNILMAIGAYQNAIKFGFQDMRAILRSYEFACRVSTFQPSERAYFANLYRQIGMEEQALALYRQVVAEGFHDPALIETLIEILELAAEHEANQNLLNTYLMEISELHLTAKDVPRALASFRRVKFPVNQNFSLVKRIARLLIERQDYRSAFDYLSKIPVDDENKQLINRITIELEKIGELDTAVYLLQFINDNDLVIREAQALREKEMEIHTELAVADLNFASSRYDSAMSSYVKVLQLGYKEDAFVLSKIVELLPLIRSDHVDDLHVIGDYFFRKQDWYRATQFYELILDRRMDDAVARSMLRQVYDAILSRNPNLPELRMRSGNLYLQAGRTENAIAEFKHAAQFPETNIDATRNLAIAYMKAGRYTLALEAFEDFQVQEIDLENLYQLQIIMHQRNRIAEALSLLRSIADVDDTYRDAKERMELLRVQFSQEAQKLNVDPKMRELIGDVAVGRYRYVEKLGSGGMGVVHKVFDIKLNKPVAMKILREGLASSGKAIDRFFREARIAATLNHPNIVNIYDYNINNQTHQSYISMEFIDGPSLRDMFEDYFANSSLDVGEDRVIEALHYMTQICDALHVTHSKGIIHRDIKPDNVLVVPKNHVAKITDFGIVHIEEATFTPTGALIGTPRYMSPEQVQGHKIDGRSDLYAAGIILYEWLVGTPPFISGDIAYQQVNMRPTPPIEQKQGIPIEVNDLIMKSLEKNCADRFQTARDFKAAIETVLRKVAPDGVPFIQKVPGETDFDSIV